MNPGKSTARALCDGAMPKPVRIDDRLRHYLWRTAFVGNRRAKVGE